MRRALAGEVAEQQRERGKVPQRQSLLWSSPLGFWLRLLLLAICLRVHPYSGPSPVSDHKGHSPETGINDGESNTERDILVLPSGVILNVRQSQTQTTG